MYIYILQCVYHWTHSHGAHGPVVHVGVGHPPCQHISSMAFYYNMLHFMVTFYDNSLYLFEL